MRNQYFKCVVSFPEKLIYVIRFEILLATKSLGYLFLHNLPRAVYTNLAIIKFQTANHQKLYEYKTFYMYIRVYKPTENRTYVKLLRE